jgi:pimeloyl-ACP methyl ester carboxylesterase
MLGANHPTLMIYGDMDFSHRGTKFENLTDSVPHAETLAFSGCGHFPNLEQPIQFADKLRSFTLT